MDVTAWFYVLEGKRRGPFDRAQLVTELCALDDPRRTLVWNEGLTRWSPAGDIEELARSLPPPVPLDAPIPIPAASGTLPIAGVVTAPLLAAPAPTVRDTQLPSPGERVPIGAGPHCGHEAVWKGYCRDCGEQVSPRLRDVPSRVGSGPQPRAARRFDEEPRTLNYFVLLRRCLKAAGRFSRSEFAVAYLGTIVGAFVVVFALAITLGAARVSEGATDTAIGLVVLAMTPVMFVAAIGAGIRRWHDLGKSGWYVLLGFLPIANLLVILYLLIAPTHPKADERAHASRGLVVLAAIVIAVFMVGIVAAIAIPSLLRARVSANEEASIRDLRSVISAQVAYKAANGGFYEGRLECLGRQAALSCIPGYPANGPVFLDEALASLSARSGYRRAFMATPAPSFLTSDSSPSSAFRYAYLATPLVVGQTGVRSFCGDSSGVICSRPDGLEIQPVNGVCPVGPGPGECAPLATLPVGAPGEISQQPPRTLASIPADQASLVTASASYALHGESAAKRLLVSITNGSSWEVTDLEMEIDGQTCGLHPQPVRLPPGEVVTLHTDSQTCSITSDHVRYRLVGLRGLSPLTVALRALQTSPAPSPRPAGGRTVYDDIVDASLPAATPAAMGTTRLACPSATTT